MRGTLVPKFGCCVVVGTIVLLYAELDIGNWEVGVLPKKYTISKKIDVWGKQVSDLATDRSANSRGRDSHMKSAM